MWPAVEKARKLSIPLFRGVGKGQSSVSVLSDDGTRAPGLYVAPSSIPGLREPGLWSSAAIAPGELIAIYTGQFVTEDEYERMPTAERSAHATYALELNGEDVIVLPGGAPDLTVHPAAAANEPPRGGVANALAETQGAEVDGVRYVFAALFACAAGIPANAEILWSYGKSYDRGYKAGRVCRGTVHRLSPSPDDIVHRVLAGGSRGDALYVTG